MVNEIDLLNEVQFKAIRSSGSGGQHVNKTATKVELKFNVMKSQVLTEEQKALLVKNLNTRLTNNLTLILQCGDSRSQFKNKKTVTERFLNMIKEALVEPKTRKKTKVPKTVQKKRLENKRKQSEKKTNRKPPPIS